MNNFFVYIHTKLCERTGFFMKNFLFFITGLVSGFVNGILGTGGGTVVVPSIELLGVDTKKSHSTAIAVILPITAVSAFVYFKQGNIDLKSTVILSVCGCVGGVFGAKFLKKIPSHYLKILFGASMIAGGIKGLL